MHLLGCGERAHYGVRMCHCGSKAGAVDPLFRPSYALAVRPVPCPIADGTALWEKWDSHWELYPRTRKERYNIAEQFSIGEQRGQEHRSALCAGVTKSEQRHFGFEVYAGALGQLTAEFAAKNFSRGSFGNDVDEVHFARLLISSKPICDEAAQFFF